MELDWEELDLLKNDRFMPMKALICEKVEEELAKLWEELKPLVHADSGLYPEIVASRGKISKGENYLHYAYRVLDFPSVLSREDMFLFRTMLLWGDSFSSHIILSGKYLKDFGPKFILQKDQLPDGVKLAMHENPWVWHRKTEGWKNIHEIQSGELAAFLETHTFLKITLFIELWEYPYLILRVKAWWEVVKKLVMS